MKKFKGILILLVLAVLTLTACGGNGESSTGDVTDDSEEQVTIKFYNWDNEVMARTTAGYIEQFEAENPNIKVESVSLVPGDSIATLENLDILLAAGESVDVMAFPAVDRLYQRQAMGALHPLNEFYDSEGIDPTEEYYVNPSVGDDYYGIQFNATTNFVLINKDALDAAGLEVPTAGWTWDDFAEYAEKLTVEKDGKTQYGAYFHSWPLYMNPPAQTLMKHPFLLEDGTTNFTDPSYARLFELRKKMEDNGNAKPFRDVLGADLSYRAEFFNEEAAMLLTGSWMIGEVGDLEANPHDFKTAFAPVPVVNEGDNTDYFMGGNYLAIGKSSDHKEAAYKFARFISTNMSDARTEIPGWTQADLEPFILDIIAGNEEYYDVDSLLHTVTSDEIGYLDASQISIDYSGELEEILVDGFAKHMLNNEPVDEVTEWMIERATSIIDSKSE
ncbi:sugar ABC transporter substrate-binding protein [Halolactibacillus alkaliphilus]|uniref:Sugar ABC transporter substrate-binding protein n=1 Tax=Halolactibacillus alkaliphilus TaxID=442899 RepID=A0A511X0L1_9BACI|nr:extracellular solute-binding protein [Halolactibacillus alkaliphilus]GEN56488.1 sugar ABC transporter substrate-binding protein [Halolactibacillus alkaliphilus]GGN64213.1 sugar ABC transporter substrate-binding protein [Halolactibacillus alkaliphilus]SFO61656.1 multiple sugar transport system substrate-binding protein [Halolactibacillus alkaliphilus]